MAERERRKRVGEYVGPKNTVTREQLAVLEASGQYVFEEKHDGFWCLAEVEDGAIVRLSSRVGLPFEGVETVGVVGARVRDDIAAASRGQCGRFVGELTADANERGERCGTRRLHLFDILDWNGHDLRELPQTERREALEMVFLLFRPEGIIRLVEQRDPMSESTTGFAVAWFDEIIARGGEGVVAKLKTQRYRAANADGKIEGWARAKKKRTVDYVVMAHGIAEKGTPNVDLGLYKNGKLVKVCTVLIPPSWRVSDPQTLVGCVVEAAGWEIWPSGALRHAQLNHRSGPRADKRPEDCDFSQTLDK